MSLNGIKPYKKYGASLSTLGNRISA